MQDDALKPELMALGAYDGSGAVCSTGAHRQRDEGGLSSHLFLLFSSFPRLLVRVELKGSSLRRKESHHKATGVLFIKLIL